MFNKAENVRILGGSFSITTNNSVNGPASLDALYKRAAPNAILNAGGRADEVRCHPGTREEVISRIEKWRDTHDGPSPSMFWLSGPAGAGKSAIVQTIAERCNAEGTPQANFFFFRRDVSRNSVSPLIATLVHQIILLYPAVRDLVAAMLSTNPLILDATLEAQLVQLIFTPLQAIQLSSSSYVPPLLLIDGLDECVSEEKLSQRKILDAFDNVLTRYPFVTRVLVASRDESQIRAAFNSMSFPLLPLYLDNQYQPENDIRVFVVDAFERLRKTHPLAYTLPAAWPSAENVESIVKKSSGQFIYSATVMRFLMNSSSNPTLSLARVQGAHEVSVNSKSPFVHLDTVYSYILSQVDNQKVLKDILLCQLLMQETVQLSSSNSRGTLLQLLHIYDARYTSPVIESCLADVTSIAQYKNDELLFHHASFPDYLLDLSRSGDYFVDLNAFNFRIQPTLWSGLPAWRDGPVGVHWMAWRGLGKLLQLPPGFLHVMIALPEMAFTGGRYHSEAMKCFTHLHSLCNREDDMKKYKQIVRQWTKAVVVKYHYGFPDVPDKGRRPIIWDVWPPYVLRYLAMSTVEASSGDLQALDADPGWGELSDVIPRDAADVPETATWLTTVLRGTHLNKKCRTDIQEYKKLVREWTLWAAQNNIPLSGVDDVPSAKWYYAMANIERDITTDIALEREEDCDITETAVWLTGLLDRIHKEKYYTSHQEYNQLLRKWTSWAIRNDIPLEGVENLPNASWYLVRSRLEKRVADRLRLTDVQGWRVVICLLAVTGLINALLAFH